MKQTPKPSKKSANREFALFGILLFMGVGLLAVPIVIGLLFVIAYMPVGVAIFIPLAYFTRRRWSPWLKERSDRYFSSPELDRLEASMRGPIREPVTPDVGHTPPSSSGDRSDLRDVNRP